MTTLDILGLQRRMRQLGEIHIGHLVDTGKVSERTGKAIKRPAKLDKFRVTSASRHTLEEIAKLYGGQVQAWTPANGGPSEWEVFTDTDRLPVIIPPANAVSQSFEMYKGSKCVRRCDGRIESKSDRACMCDPEQRDCLLTTRLNVMLRDVQGLGVWLLTSRGFYAAVELPPVVEFLASTNGYVDAFLTMELKRVVLDDGTVAEFQVPKIDVAVTPAQLLAGQGAISAPAIEATQHRAALTGERPAIAASAEAPRDDERDAAYIQRAIECRLADEVRDIYREAVESGHMHELLAQQLTTVGKTKSQRPAEAAADVPGTGPQQQTERTPAERHIAAALASQTLPDLITALKAAVAEGFAKDPNDQSDPVAQAFVARRKLLETPAPGDAPAAPAGDQSRAALWTQAMALSPFDRTDELEQAFAALYQGATPGTAELWQLEGFLVNLRAGDIKPIPAAAPTTSGTESEVPF